MGSVNSVDDDEAFVEVVRRGRWSGSPGSLLTTGTPRDRRRIMSIVALSLHRHWTVDSEDERGAEWTYVAPLKCLICLTMLVSSWTSEGYMKWSEHAVATKFPYLRGKAEENDEEKRGKERGLYVVHTEPFICGFDLLSCL